MTALGYILKSPLASLSFSIFLVSASMRHTYFYLIFLVFFNNRSETCFYCSMSNEFIFFSPLLDFCSHHINMKSFLFCLFPFFFLYTKRRPMCAQGKVFSLSDRGLRPYCIVHIIAQSQSCFCNACSRRSSAAVGIVATISLMQTGFCLPNGLLPFAHFAMN